MSLARQMANAYKFNEIAEAFYEHGILDQPEKPWPGIEGSKYDYALTRLSAAADQEAVLAAVPRLIYDAVNGLDFDHPMNVSVIESALTKLGFTKTLQDETGAPFDLYDYEPPAQTQQISPTSVARSLQERIDKTGLPSTLGTLIDELNDNLERQNWNASALIIRRVLTLASFIAMRKIGKESELQPSTGDLELNAVIAKCQENFRIAPQVVSRVLGAKWIGDSANHSYKLRITESDVETSVTACRLYLSELGLYED